jgi:hypothetical protein
MALCLTSVCEMVISVLFASLQVLELDHNNLTQLDASTLQAFGNKTGLQHLTLHANPWHCDCEARGMLSFLQEHFTQVWKTCNIEHIGMHHMSSSVIPGLKHTLVAGCLSVQHNMWRWFRTFSGKSHFQ